MLSTQGLKVQGQGLVVRGQGLVVQRQGQGLVNWSLRTRTFLEDHNTANSNVHRHHFYHERMRSTTRNQQPPERTILSHTETSLTENVAHLLINYNVMRVF